MAMTDSSELSSTVETKREEVVCDDREPFAATCHHQDDNTTTSTSSSRTSCSSANEDLADEACEHREDASTTADSESNRSETSPSVGQATSSAWSAVSVRQGVRRDSLPSSSHSILHLRLCFLDLCKLPQGDAHWAKLVVDLVTLMRRCLFAPEDICSVLAHASAYFQEMQLTALDTLGMRGQRVLVVLVYIAHCYVLDKTCPLRYWREHILQDDACSLKALDAMVVPLMGLRGFKLRLEDDELRRRYSALYWASGCGASLGASPKTVAPAQGFQCCCGFEDVRKAVGLLLLGGPKKHSLK